MFDPGLDGRQRERAKLMYFALVLAPFLLVWRIVLALQEPTGWNIAVAVAAAAVLALASRWAWRAWRDYD